MMNDDDLKRLLQQGDPAGDGNEPSPVETAAMRRAVTDAAEHAAAGRGLLPFLSFLRGGFGAPAAALATISVVALAAWLALSTDTRPSPVADVVEPPPVAVDPALGEPNTPETPQVPEADEPTAREPATAAESTEPLALEPAGSEETIAVADTDPGRKSRTVQFTSPRGTRIIWTLDPNFESPIAAAPARQEQGK